MHLSPPLASTSQLGVVAFEALDASDVLIMSALESPPTLLTPTWPDPWSTTGGHQLGNIHHQGTMGMSHSGMHVDMNSGIVLPMNGMLGGAPSTHDFYGSSGHSSDVINNISPVMGHIKNLDLQSLQPVTSSSNQELSSNHAFLSLHPNSNVNNISINSSSSDNSCNSGTNNTGSVGSVTSGGSKKRTVNFKLDIKPEPLINPSNNIGIPGEHDSIHCVPQGVLQKVPSISDLSEPESSLDLPVAQVSTQSIV